MSDVQEHDLSGPTKPIEAMPDPKAPLNRTKEKAKPKTVTLSGGEKIELRKKADLTLLEKETKAIGPQLSKIVKADADLLSDYLALGKFQSTVTRMFKSTKLAGLFIKDKLPEASKIDPAVRSNSKWLWEALNVDDHEASDILFILGGITKIGDYKSAHPSVIARHYKKAKTRVEGLKKASENKIDTSDEESALEKLSVLEAKNSAKKMARDRNAAVKNSVKYFIQQPDKECVISKLESVLKVMLKEKSVAKQLLYLQELS